MSVVTLVVPGSHTDEVRELAVTGSTYDPAAGEVQGATDTLDACLMEVSRVATLCNECDVQLHEGVFKAVGQVRVLHRPCELPRCQAGRGVVWCVCG
jgi:hypothetical protein